MEENHRPAHPFAHPSPVPRITPAAPPRSRWFLPVMSVEHVRPGPDGDVRLDLEQRFASRAVVQDIVSKMPPAASPSNPLADQQWVKDHASQAVKDKADKAVPQTAGNFAALTQDGNLVDSRTKPSDYEFESGSSGRVSDPWTCTPPTTPFNTPFSVKWTTDPVEGEGWALFTGDTKQGKVLGGEGSTELSWSPAAQTSGYSVSAVRQLSGTEYHLKGQPDAKLQPAGDYASGRQGAKADTAVQPEDLPEKLPNPKALKFVSGSVGTYDEYDGSSEKTIGHALAGTFGLVRLSDRTDWNRTADDGAFAATPAAVKTVNDKVTAIEGKIPSQASASNQLADKEFVNSSVATNTAAFRGTFNLVTDLELPLNATHEQVAAAVKTKLGQTAYDKLDYVFVQIPQDLEHTDAMKQVDRYKCVETGTAPVVKTWEYEWTLNNSSFTAAQWAAINSGITAGKIDELRDKLDLGVYDFLPESWEVSGPHAMFSGGTYTWDGSKQWLGVQGQRAIRAKAGAPNTYQLVFDPDTGRELTVCEWEGTAVQEVPFTYNGESCAVTVEGLGNAGLKPTGDTLVKKSEVPVRSAKVGTRNVDPSDGVLVLPVTNSATSSDGNTLATAKAVKNASDAAAALCAAKRNYTDMTCDKQGFPVEGSGFFTVTKPDGTKIQLNPFSRDGIKGWSSSGDYSVYPIVFLQGSGANINYRAAVDNTIGGMRYLSQNTPVNTIEYNDETWVFAAYTGGKDEIATKSQTVPTSRTVNGKALSSDVTLTGADIAVSGTDATKIDAALADKATKAGATLTERFSAWGTVYNGEGQQPYPLRIVKRGNQWVLQEDLSEGGAGTDWVDASDPQGNATSTEIEYEYLNTTVTATRTALQGYQLGSQTDKPLASEAEAEALRQGKQDKLSNGQLANIDAVPDKRGKLDLNVYEEVPAGWAFTALPEGSVNPYSSLFPEWDGSSGRWMLYEGGTLVGASGASTQEATDIVFLLMNYPQIQIRAVYSEGGTTQTGDALALTSQVVKTPVYDGQNHAFLSATDLVQGEDFVTKGLHRWTCPRKGIVYMRLISGTNSVTVRIGVNVAAGATDVDDAHCITALSQFKNNDNIVVPLFLTAGDEVCLSVATNPLQYVLFTCFYTD